MSAATTARVIAHPNIALVKYWGKRPRSANVPAADSLSLTLGPMHTETTLRWVEGSADQGTLDGRPLSEAVARRLSGFLDLVRAMRPGLGGAHFETRNDFPTAAGLASSSSGFAALALAATQAAGLSLDPAALSRLARQGSGSAARSIFGGFAWMHAGSAEDGSDAFAEAIAPADHWPLKVVVAITMEGAKDVPSTDGMNLTEATSPYYDAWLNTVPPAIQGAREAIEARDFERLAEVAEASALQMHASALAAVPGVIYWRGATLEALHTVRALRAQGTEAFFTIDAGPHVKVFCTPNAEARVREALMDTPGVLRTLVAEPAEGAHVLPEGSHA